MPFFSLGRNCFKRRPTDLVVYFTLQSSYSALVSIFQEEHATYLILEYCPGGDLVEYLCQQANQVFSEDLSRLFFCQLTAGVKYLHKLGIVHR